MPATSVTFSGSQGGTLAALLDLPSGPPVAYALFAHCFTCSKDVFASARIAAALTGAGFAVLRFDFTGLGASEGDFADTNFSSNLEDLRRAASWLTANHRPPQLLVGHSLGGAAVIAVASELSSVRAVATIGAPADVAHVTSLLTQAIPTIEAEGEATVDIAGRPFTVRRQLLEDLGRTSVLDSARSLGRPLLIAHSPDDAQVDVEQAGRLYRAARHPKSFVALDGADHLLTRRQDAAFAGSMIATWARRYVVDETPTSGE